MGTCHNPWCPTQGGRAQPHIPASAAPVSWRSRATPRKSAPQNFLWFRFAGPQNPGSSQKKLWRCVMSSEPRRVSDPSPKESLGSLSGCLVDGDAEQRMRERRVKRRALAISILLQSAVLAALILVPLFGKAERISLTIVTPIPPYSRYRNASPKTADAPPRQPSQHNARRFCPPLSIP